MKAMRQCDYCGVLFMDYDPRDNMGYDKEYCSLKCAALDEERELEEQTDEATI